MTDEAKKQLTSDIAAAVPALELFRQFAELRKGIDSAFPGRALSEFVQSVQANVAFTDDLRAGVLKATAANRDLIEQALATTGGLKELSRAWSVALSMPELRIQWPTIEMTSVSERIRDAALRATNISTSIRLHTEQTARTYELLAEAVQRATVQRNQRLLEAALVAKEMAREHAASVEETAPTDSSLLFEGVVAIADELKDAQTPHAVENAAQRLLMLARRRMARVTSALEIERLNLVLTLLSFLLAIWTAVDSQEDQDKFIAAMREVPTQIVQAIMDLEALHQKVPDLARGITTARAHLREGPARTSRSYMVLEAYQEVAFVEMLQGWAKVQYYDDLADELITGWVYARHVHVLADPENRHQL